MGRRITCTHNLELTGLSFRNPPGVKSISPASIRVKGSVRPVRV